MWKIILADGSIIDGLTVSGNNFVSKREITPAMFLGKLSRVTIEAPKDEKDLWGLAGVHEHMRLVTVQHHGSDYYFVLEQIPADELERSQNRADLEYLAMMTGVDL